MTEHPATVALEAKAIYQSLKELLKTKEPFDKELEFQRKNLRKRYLTLLLVHPYAKESKDAENHLWMQTSYASISSYKERLTAIDRAIQASNRQPQQGQHPVHGPVEHRKLLARFRQFLAEEERFWIQLVLRMYRSFGLHEAEPALAALGLVQEEDGGGHFAFPDDPSQSLVPTSPAARKSRLAILSKALICLGDIARYRELYNEAGGRPRAGQEGGRPAKRGRNRRGGAPVDTAPQPRRYDNAQQRYEQARWLVPQEGNPFHQLAILATYRKDSFSSVYCYYRALCVRQPYETAADNLATVLQKALDQWKRTRKDRDRMLATGTFDIKDRVQLFKERVVVLHAIWRKGIDRMDTKFRDHDKIVYQDFRELVAERHLPIDMISNVMVLAEGALWKHRMIRDSIGHKQREDPSAPPPESSIATEWRMLQHLLDIHSALMETGKDQLKELPSMDSVDHDLAQRITAVFRRTLPALRIASKWLRANLGYVMGDLEFKAYQDKEKLRSVAVEKMSTKKLSAHSINTIRFWRGYAQFVTILSQAFPSSKLPSLTAPLEEDTDLRGFLPLKKLMAEAPGTAAEAAAGIPKESPHPNEEQLMRISDLLRDARALLATENAPLVSVDDAFAFDESRIEAWIQHLPQDTERTPLQAVPPQQQQIMNNIRDRSAVAKPAREEDAMTEVTSRTDDDVLKAAFQHIGVEDDEDDDEIVLYNPKGSLSPVLSPIMQATPITPAKSLNGATAITGLPSPPTTTLSPNIGKTPIASPRTGHVAAITAQDLLMDVMNAGRKPGVGFAHPPPVVESAPSVQPPLLFGGDLANSNHLNGPSIWAAGQDEQVLKFGANTSPGGHHAFQISPRIHSHGIGGAASQEFSGMAWPSSQPSTQSSQVRIGGVLPSGVHPSPMMHHRVSSLLSPSLSQPALMHGSYPSALTIGSGAPHHIQPVNPFTSNSMANIPRPPQMQSHQSLPQYAADFRSATSLGGFQNQMDGASSSHLFHLGVNGVGYEDPIGLGRQGYQSQPPSNLQDHRTGSTGRTTSPLSSIWGTHG